MPHSRRACTSTVDAVFDDPELNALVDGFVVGDRGRRVVERPVGQAAAAHDARRTRRLSGLASCGRPRSSTPTTAALVDFGERRRMLRSIDAAFAQGDLPAVDASGAAKLLVTSRALRLRRDRPELFTRYTPMTAVGEASDHVIAFDRGGAVAVATRLPVGLEAARAAWGDTLLLRHAGVTIDVLTGRRFEGSTLRVARAARRRIRSRCSSRREAGSRDHLGMGPATDVGAAAPTRPRADRRSNRVKAVGTRHPSRWRTVTSTASCSTTRGASVPIRALDASLAACTNSARGSTPTRTTGATPRGPAASSPAR